jgi:WD40 repeat protein
MPVTSNKMRGPLSDQPAKIGEHVFHTVDHIFFSAGDLQFERMTFSPLCFPSKDEATLHLLPSHQIPSDHAPVMADLCFRKRVASLDDSKIAQGARRKSGTARSAGNVARVFAADKEAQKPQYLSDPRCEPVKCVSFSSDGAMLASVTEGKTVGGHLRVQSVKRTPAKCETVDLLWPKGTRLPVECVAFSPEITIGVRTYCVLVVSTGSNDQGELLLYVVERQLEHSSLPVLTKMSGVFPISAIGKSMTWRSSVQTEDNTVRSVHLAVGTNKGPPAIYRVDVRVENKKGDLVPVAEVSLESVVKMGNLKRRPGSEKEAVLSMHFSPVEDRLLVIGGEFSEVMLLDTLRDVDDDPEGCTVARLYYGAFVNEVGFCPRGKMIAAAGYANHVTIWDADKPPLATEWNYPELHVLRHDGPVMSLGFHPHSRTVSTAKAPESSAAPHA